MIIVGHIRFVKVSIIFKKSQNEYLHVWLFIFQAIADINSKYFKVDLDPAMTNILMVFLQTDKFVAKDVLQRLASVEEKDDPKVSVRAISRNPKFVRITLYHEITDEDVHLAIRKIQLVIREFDCKY